MSIMISEAKGDSIATLEQINNLPQPVGLTPTHYPLAHADIVHTMRHGIMERLPQWNVDPSTVVSDYVLSGDDAERAFALFSFPTSDGINRCVAMKNSHNMQFRLSVMGGMLCSFCTNLDLMPTELATRKHTKGIIGEYKDIIGMALDTVSNSWVAQEKRYAAWKDHHLDRKGIDHLLMESMRQGVVPSSKLSQVFDQFQTPEYAEYGKDTAWTAHSAVTHVLRGSNLHTMEKKTTALGRVIDGILDPEGLELEYAWQN